MFASLVLLAAGAGPVRADACSSCPEPTLQDLAALPGFTLHALPADVFGHRPTDYVETDAGECTYVPKNDPQVAITASRLVLRGVGEVWHCPHSSSDDQITYSIAAGDSTEWKVAGEVGATLKAVALEVAGKVSGGYASGRSTNEVKTVTKTLRAAMGHRIAWEGYFEIASLALTVEVDVTRRWSWWTKNARTFDVVLRSGSIWMSCGTERVPLARSASIRYAIHLLDRACGAPPGTPPDDLGWFPLPPPTTPSDDAPAPAPPDPAPGDEPPVDGGSGGGTAGPDEAPPAAAGPAAAPEATPPAPGTTPPAPGTTPAAPGTSPDPEAGAEPYADPEFRPWPPPSPTNPHPRDSSEAGWAPTGPAPDPMRSMNRDDDVVAALGPPRPA
jgi:hypothetical protein